jgi:RNase P/RNase MRP subunit p30
MHNSKQRAVAESVFNRNQRREAEINDALAQEAARHEAAIENVYRLRALRLAGEQRAQMRQQKR